MHISNYDIIRKSWNGIEFEIRWNPDYVAFDDGGSMAHLEIESLDRSPLPVTETGYRSHFIHEAEVSRFGGAEAYVDAWFASVMLTPQGRTTLQAACQLSLF
jgi:hypothetical protein